jgi:hypothetical protein
LGAFAAGPQPQLSNPTHAAATMTRRQRDVVPERMSFRMENHFRKNERIAKIPTNRGL